MSRSRCIVPNCDYRKTKKTADARSLFKCPANPARARLWANSIPGLSFLGPNDHVCDWHFEDTSILTHYDDKGHKRCRLTSTAIPTLFGQASSLQRLTVRADPTFSDQPKSLQQGRNEAGAVPMLIDQESPLQLLPIEPSPTQALNCYPQDYYYSCQSAPNTQPEYFGTNHNNSSSIDNFEVSQIVLKNPPSNTKRIDNLMSDVVKDLKASEQLLMKIKKEELWEEGIQNIKTEPTEDSIQNMRIEKKKDMKKLTVSECMIYNHDYLITLLPESWSVNQLPTETDVVFAFSKECTVNENEGLLVMYEKNIVVNSDGKVHYSIHGKTINVEDAVFPKHIRNTETLLKIIMQFNEVKVCQGIMAHEFEVDKDCIIYKDDLGLCRHVDCSLISDQLQCDSCYNYNKHLSSLVNNGPVLVDTQFFYNQNYYN